MFLSSSFNWQQQQQLFLLFLLLISEPAQFHPCHQWRTSNHKQQPATDLTATILVVQCFSSFWNIFSFCIIVVGCVVICVFVVIVSTTRTNSRSVNKSLRILRHPHRKILQPSLGLKSCETNGCCGLIC